MDCCFSFSEVRKLATLWQPNTPQCIFCLWHLVECLQQLTIGSHVHVLNMRDLLSNYSSSQSMLLHAWQKIYFSWSMQRDAKVTSKSVDVVIDVGADTQRRQLLLRGTGLGCKSSSLQNHWHAWNRKLQELLLCIWHQLYSSGPIKQRLSVS